MPMMVCASDRVISTTQGYTFRFTANEPTHVPSDMVSYVMERGAYPASQADAAVVSAATETPKTDLQRTPRDPEDRKLLILACMDEMIKSGEMVFTASGKPSPAFLSKKLKFEIDAVERDEVWTRYQAEGKAA